MLTARRAGRGERVLDAGCGTRCQLRPRHLHLRLQTVADPAFTLRNLRRVLQPGGTFLLGRKSFTGIRKSKRRPSSDSRSGRHRISPAYVVLNQGETATAEEIMEFINAQVAGYEKIREVVFRTELPVRPGGKGFEEGAKERGPVRKEDKQGK